MQTWCLCYFVSGCGVDIALVCLIKSTSHSRITASAEFLLLLTLHWCQNWDSSPQLKSGQREGQSPAKDHDVSDNVIRLQKEDSMARLEARACARRPDDGPV